MNRSTLPETSPFGVGVSSGPGFRITHMGRSRIFWRLFLGTSVLLAASIGLLGLLIDTRVEDRERDRITETLRHRAVLVEQALPAWPPPGPALQQRLAQLRQETGMRITLIAADGEVLADSDQDYRIMDNHADREEVMQAKESGTGTSTRPSHTLGREMRYVARRASAQPSGVAYVRVSLPQDTILQELGGLRRIIWGVAAATAVAALLLALFLARRLATPLQELTAGAERIAAGEYGHKVYAIGQDEIGTLGRAFNIMSERLAAQFAQVEEDRQQLRAVLSGMVEGVVAIDAQQRILFANERAGELLEFSTQAAVGRHLWEVVRQPGIQEVVRRAQGGSETNREELDLNGSVFKSMAVHVAPLSGSPARGAVLVLHDTSELRRLERLRQEFVANVSHELKTPLSVIKACVETLLDGAVDDPENRGAFLEQIEEQANRLHALILDLLSLTRIESGAEVFEFQAVDLGGAVTDCLERHRARAEAKRITLEVMGEESAVKSQESGVRSPESAVKKGGSGRRNGGASPLPPDSGPLTPVLAWADEEAIDHILENLVDNALKYTPEGGKIAVRWAAEDGHVCLEVEDTGIGIPARDLPRIFERFYRVDKARSRELGGTGLGLSIVKHLVQAMQGSVRATSVVGQGTTFHVRLPRPPAP